MTKRKRTPESFPHRSSKKTKYYAVAKGRTPAAVYTSWEECQRHVKGYKGAVFKSFASPEEAEAFLQSHAAPPTESRGIPSVNNNLHSTTSSTTASLPAPVVPPPPMDAAASVSTVMIPAGSSITISATAPTTVTIQVMGQNGTASNDPPTIAATHPSTEVTVPAVPIPPTLPLVLDLTSEEASQQPEAVAVPESTVSGVSGRRVQIWFDGGARGNPGVVAGAGAVVAVISPDHEIDAFRVRQFLNGTRSYQDLQRYTNNEAEYSAIIVALQVLLDYLRRQPPHVARMDSIEIRGDSLVILNQLSGVFHCKSPRLWSYFTQARELLRQCIQHYLPPVTMDASSVDRHPHLRLCHVPRALNQNADALANEAMDQQQSWMTRSDDGHQQRYPLPEL